jgi:glycosyltransferase involved in cell wall biosynthesis
MILPLSPMLARLYKKSLRKYKNIIVCSKHIQQSLGNVCGVSSEVIYPPVIIPAQYHQTRQGLYYVIISRIDASKEIEIAIHACNVLRVRLKIAGVSIDVQYERYLRHIAGPTIEFLGFQDDAQQLELYRHAIALLFTARSEDFGITPVEAMAHGVPVIAYCGGGVKETVIDKKTGVFYSEHSVAALVTVLETFNPKRFNPIFIRRHAEHYSEANFHKHMGLYIQNALLNRKNR